MGSSIPRLIVNGDDFGRSRNLTYGVVEAFHRGILTSTSIVANGPAADLAAKLAKETPRLGVGVHVVLDEYSPLADPGQIPSLVREDGSFYPRGACFRRLLLRQARCEDVRTEWEAQLQKTVALGIQPTHIDGHGHCHARPAVAGLVLELAAKFHIKAARLPSESLLRFGRVSRFPIGRYLAKVVLSCACLKARARWRRRLRYPDAFFGFMDGGGLDVGSLEAISASLRPGVSELMVHPGVCNADEPFSCTYDWEADLETVTRYSKGDFQKRFGVRLVSYREAWE